MKEDRFSHIVLAPLKSWAAMLLLLVVTAIYAQTPYLPAKLVVNVVLAMGQIALVATFLMQLRTSRMLVRLAALAGLIWASFLFLFTFADFLTR
ncbi:hypothetical protein [Stakelama pacifica]|uniref:Caa(3)-type oxidase subunit IV n=1 Tax=Stakelama pacifica TaxID=517720 RepID=A0A4R6FY59_9SPHN|nr:hypothetical protein [Stakelama pacifica]TDN86892.1 caa(3)-type oxidase subunit IV [Stakelama pacifica]GGO90995.1 hypothetical protein GCM10011329_04640 [Stakelama pacifica]